LHWHEAALAFLSIGSSFERKKIMILFLVFVGEL
jgi:hypothetical protein